MVLSHSFLWLSSIPVYVYATYYLSIHLLKDIYVVFMSWPFNSAAVNIGVHVSFQVIVFSGYMPRSGIAGALYF